MTIATTLVKYLAQNGISYDVLPHRHTDTSLNSAHAASVPAEQVAKSVIFEDEQGYLMAVIPATRHVKIREVNKLTHRKLGLATEAELSNLFGDCETGAIPALGPAYGLTTIVDSSLSKCPDIYFEAGDHEDMIHIKGSAFRRLMKETTQGSICIH